MKYVLILTDKLTDKDVVSHPASLKTVVSASKYAKLKHLQFKISVYNPQKHDGNMVGNDN